MNRIVTRGFGPDHLIITRGYGVSGLVTKLKEVLRLTSKIARNLFLESKWKKRN
jgi:hypothetical protein